MPNTKPSATTVERQQEKLQLASEKSLVNYGFYIGATPENIHDLQTATNTPGIKIFIGLTPASNKPLPMAPAC